MRGLVLKLATESWELEAIHRLNYKTFVEEIPQHSRNPGRRLVDKFNLENTYFIAVVENQLVGMVCLRGNRPFSLDGKISNLDDYLPSGRSLCEVRLLSIERRYRHTVVTSCLADFLFLGLLERSYNCAVISATIRQLKFYAHLGFVPFGHVVGSGNAVFQPMYLLAENYRRRKTHERHGMPALKGVDDSGQELRG